MLQKCENNSLIVHKRTKMTRHTISFKKDTVLYGLKCRGMVSFPGRYMYKWTVPFSIQAMKFPLVYEMKRRN